ncbi:MAG: AEC family transporter [Clostridia bacterium]|nr:AEC family transporter [Clostridia bacterium]
MSNAVGIVITIFIIMGIGVGLGALGWIDERISRFLSRFVIKVAFPAAVIQNMFTKFTKDLLASMAAGLVVPFLSIALVLGIGYLVSKRMKLPQNRKGAFVCLFTFSNSVFIGLPVCNALFGEESATSTLMYYIATTVLFWSLGYMLMRRDGQAEKEKRTYRDIPAYLFAKDKSDARWQGAQNALTYLGKTVPLPLVAMFLSIILILCGVQLPKFLISTAGYLGNTVTPLSLVYIGYMLSVMLRQRNIRWQKGFGVIMAGKFILMPGMVILALQLFGLIPAVNSLLTAQLKSVLIMESAMPCMTQTTIVESGCGGDASYTAGATVLTTLMTFAVIPLFTYIISVLV